MNQSMLIIDDDTAVLASCQRIFTLYRRGVPGNHHYGPGRGS